MNVAIIDYGSGNLRSAAKAFERAVSELGGGSIELTKDPDRLKNFSHLVLPGVGAFSDCMARLSAADGLIDSLQEQVFNKTKPFLEKLRELINNTTHKQPITKDPSSLAGCLLESLLKGFSFFKFVSFSLVIVNCLTLSISL